MARKDVDLVISAKDRAKGVVDSITKALEAFNGTTKDMAAGAERGESTLAALGASVRDLGRIASQAKIGQTLGTDMDKAASALSRMEGRVEATSAELSQLQKRQERVGAESDRYAGKLDRAGAAIARQKQSVADLSSEHARLSKQYSEAERANSKAATATERLSTAHGEAQARVAKLSAEHDKLQTKIAQTENPTKRLQASLDSKSRALASATGRMNELGAELAEVSTQAARTDQEMRSLDGGLSRATTRLSEQRGVLASMESSYSELQASAKQIDSVQRSLATEARKTTDELGRQEVQLAGLEDQFVQTAQSAGKFDEAMARTQRVGQGNLEKQLIDQGQAAARAEAEVRELSAAYARLSTDVGRAGVPTREMSAALAQSRQRLEEASFKAMAHGEALEAMGRDYREVGNDIESIANGQARFIASQKSLESALSSTAADGLKARNAIRDLHRETEGLEAANRRAAQSANQLADANRRGASATGGFADAYRRFYGDTRRSLSLMQRLRGEVLSLVAAYAGFYGAIEAMRGATNAALKLEGAMARLQVVNGGDIDQSAKDMDFLRRTADRLGIELGVLSNEYSKFAVATKGTNLEGQRTKDIFLSVAEAAVVNRSSVEEMGGVFKALTQIASKGFVQMEELKEQLGDRLPGALQLMADGLGKSTGELIKMMEQGQVTSDALVGFADQLDQKFGPQLAASLGGAQVAFGKLKTEAFEAGIEFANGGFLTSLVDLANTLRETLADPATIDFIRKLSAAMGFLLDVVGAMASNLDILVPVLAGMASLRIAPLFIAAGRAVGTFTGAIVGSTGAVATFNSTLRTTGSTATAASVGIGRFTAALRTLLSTTGIGLLITGISIAIGSWATKASDATEALVEHQSQLDTVRNAYEETGGDIAKIGGIIDKAFSLAEAKENLIELRTEFAKAVSAFERTTKNSSFLTNFFGIDLTTFTAIRDVSKEYSAAMNKVFQDFEAGRISASELVAAVDAVATEFDDGSENATRFGAQNVRAAREVAELAGAVTNQAEVVGVAGDSIEETEAALGRLNSQTQDTTTSTQDGSAAFGEGSANVENYADAVDELNGYLPEATAEMKRIEDIARINELMKAGIDAASSWAEVVAIIKQAGIAMSEVNNQAASMSRGDYEAAFSGARFNGSGQPGTPIGNGVTISNSQMEELIQAVTVLGEQKGLDPRDILAAMSFETIGTFNPNIVGGKDNQYQGLIQWSPENRERYGINEGMSITDQVMKAGEYFTDRGVEAGDGLMQIYASILAGHADLIDRGDSNNGGVVTSVRSAVNGGLNGHVEKANGLYDAYAGIAGQAERRLAAEEDANQTLTRNAEAAIATAEREQAARAEEITRAREATQSRIDDGQFQISQQELINAGREREAVVTAAIRQARAENAQITEQELATIGEQAGRQFDLQQATEATASASKEDAEARKAAVEATRQVTALEQQRAALTAQLKVAVDQGDTAKAEELRGQIEEVNAQLESAIANARDMWDALGGSAADTANTKLDATATKLETARMKSSELKQSGEQQQITWQQVGDMFANDLSGAFSNFAQMVAEGKSIGEAARTAFLKFASDFLIKLGQMILQQTIFNAVRGITGGMPGGSIFGGGGGGLFGTAHTGGRVGGSRIGSGNSTRRVSPAAFAGAASFHSGGLPGLRSNEVPAILERGEEVLTSADPRHILNGGLSMGGGKAERSKTTVANFFDAKSFLESGLNDPDGKSILMNFVSANSSEFKAALE